MKEVRAVFDANVLFSRIQTDAFLFPAQVGVAMPLWSAGIRLHESLSPRMICMIGRLSPLSWTSRATLRMVTGWARKTLTSKIMDSSSVQAAADLPVP